MDTDLDTMSREQLVAEVLRLRNAIRKHRDSSGHELCWHQPELWGLLPEPSDPLPVVPEWPQFLEGCIRYRRSLDEQAPGAPRTARRYDDGDDQAGARRDCAESRLSQHAGAEPDDATGWSRPHLKD